MSLSPLVCVVDDDADVRDSLRMLLESAGMEVASYASADAFLESAPATCTRPCCLLLDVRMPGMSGMGLLEHLRENKIQLPAIMVTGHGDIPMAVRAMKLGAVDFIVKPFNHEDLLDLVQEALRASPQLAAAQLDENDLAERWASLTEREQEIFWAVAGGNANKVIAFDLGISVRTVEAHRARIMKKMGVRKLADLVLLSVGLQHMLRSDDD